MQQYLPELGLGRGDGEGGAEEREGGTEDGEGGAGDEKGGAAKRS